MVSTREIWKLVHKVHNHNLLETQSFWSLWIEHRFLNVQALVVGTFSVIVELREGSFPALVLWPVPAGGWRVCCLHLLARTARCRRQLCAGQCGHWTCCCSLPSVNINMWMCKQNRWQQSDWLIKYHGWMVRGWMLWLSRCKISQKGGIYGVGKLCCICLTCFLMYIDKLLD